MRKEEETASFVSEEKEKKNLHILYRVLYSIT